MFPNKKQSVALVALFLGFELMVVLFFAWSGVSFRSGEPLIGLFAAVVSSFLILKLVLPKMGLRVYDLFHAEFNDLKALLLIVSIPIIILMFSMQVLSSYLHHIYSDLMPRDNYINDALDLVLNSGFVGFIYGCIVMPLIEEVISGV